MYTARKRSESGKKGVLCIISFPVACECVVFSRLNGENENGMITTIVCFICAHNKK